MIRRLMRKLGASRHVARLPVWRSVHRRSHWSIGPAPHSTQRRPGVLVDARTVLAIVAVAVACGSYLLGASVTPSASGDVGNEVGVSRAEGFDSCELPKFSEMKYMWEHNKYRPAYIGFYVGGIIPYGIEHGQCKKHRPHKAIINALHAVGYDFLPVMDGRQPPCSIDSTSPAVHFSEDETEHFLKAREEAAEEADTAVERMKALGFTTPGSIVYYDIESFANTPEHPHCLAATKEFVNNWDRRLKEAYGVSSGLYGPAGGAQVDEFWNLPYNPDDLWYSETQANGDLKLNEEHESVWAVPKNKIPDDHWEHRRLHQWERELRLTFQYPHSKETEYHIDLSCAMGLVAGSGEKREEPKCVAK